MKFWFTHSSAISLQSQIIEQVRLGIASSELAAGERLPSVRAFARIYGLHANTVSAAYSQLERQGFVRHKRGGGKYVVQHLPSASNTDFRDVIGMLRKEGLSDLEITIRFKHALEYRPSHMLVETDEEAARLIVFEVRKHGYEIPVCSMPVAEYRNALAGYLSGSIPVVLPSRLNTVREALGEDAKIVTLEISAFTELFAKQLPLSRDVLVGLASHWPRFLEIAGAMLLSAGFDPETLIYRDARSTSWLEGLDSAAAVLCDSYTASVMPASVNARVFPLLSAKTLEVLASPGE